MSIQTDLYSLLSNFAGLTALVSTNIYAAKASQSTGYPMITYRSITSKSINSLDGTGLLFNSIYQFDIYASTQQECFDISDQMIVAMKTATFKNILQSRIDAEFDDTPDVYRLILDYSVWHN